MANQIGNIIKQNLPSQNPSTPSSEKSSVAKSEAPQSTQAIAKPQEYSTAHKTAMATQIGACLVTQRTYGKQGSDTEAILRVFMADLADFPAEDVINAIAQWRKTSAEFPTPHDIRKLLKPEPVWITSLFQELTDKRKRGDYLSFTEEEYLKQFKQHAMKGL